MTTVPAKRFNLIAGVAAALGGYAFIGAFVSFLGWAINAPRLTDWIGSGVSLQPNTCILLMLAGMALILVQLQAWRTVGALGALVGSGGLLILFQHASGIDLGINEQLVFGRDWGQDAIQGVGRAGLPAAMSFALIGASLGLLGLSGLNARLLTLRRYVPLLGIAVCLVMTFSLFGYLFDAEQFYAIPWLTAIAMPTATMFMALGLALVLSVPDRDPMALVCEHSGAGRLARLTIPALIVMIPFVLWLRLEGHNRGLYDVGTGRALGALMLLVGVLAVLWVALISLRRHEQALREASQRKDEFLATLAHELRNPLAPVMNSLAILDHQGIDDASASDARRMIWRQMKHMVRLIDDLLDVSRISRGAFELRKERLQLQPIIRQTVESLGLANGASPRRVTVDLPEKPAWVDADPVRLAQIVGNLLSNAIRYSPADAEIAVRATIEDDQVSISVKDCGIGIAPDNLQTIFGMFSQVDHSLERSTGGLGIGLYLVRSLVEMHGGTVVARSEGTDKGSEFIVRLPRAQAPWSAGQAEPTADEIAPPPRLRVLVVDDNQDAATTLTILLKSQGYETHTAFDGIEALAAAERLTPDVALLDIGLPGLNGYEVCQRIRQSDWGKRMLLLALTGWGQQEDKRRAEECGFDAHLVKPVELRKLKEVLGALVRNRDSSAVAEGVATVDER